MQQQLPWTGHGESATNEAPLSQTGIQKVQTRRQQWLKGCGTGRAEVVNAPLWSWAVLVRAVPGEKAHSNTRAYSVAVLGVFVVIISTEKHFAESPAPGRRGIGELSFP